MIWWGLNPANLWKQKTSHHGEKYSGNTHVAVEDLHLPAILPPQCQLTQLLQGQSFAEALKEYVKQTSKLCDSVQQLWVLVWGQCSWSVCTQIEALTTHKMMHRSRPAQS